eukprot:jgi/Tetstr1/430988/TSEL_020742.t1
MLRLLPRPDPPCLMPWTYIDQAAARQAVNQSILVELAKGKTRAPNNDLPVSCLMLKRRDMRKLVRSLTRPSCVRPSRACSIEPRPASHGLPVNSTLQSDDAGMAYHDILLATPEAEHEIATGVFVPPTRLNGLDDFTSKLVAYFYANAHLHGLVMRHCTKIHISHRDPLMPKSNAELAQLIRRTFDAIPAEQSYSKYTMVGIILTAISDSVVNALEAAARRANEQLGIYELSCATSRPSISNTTMATSAQAPPSPRLTSRTSTSAPALAHFLLPLPRPPSPLRLSPLLTMPRPGMTAAHVPATLAMDRILS